jgi:hypothetical protein
MFSRNNRTRGFHPDKRKGYELERYYKYLKSQDMKRREIEREESRLQLISQNKIYIIKDGWEIKGFTGRVVI